MTLNPFDPETRARVEEILGERAEWGEFLLRRETVQEPPGLAKELWETLTTRILPEDFTESPARKFLQICPHCIGQVEGWCAHCTPRGSRPVGCLLRPYPWTAADAAAFASLGAPTILQRESQALEVARALLPTIQRVHWFAWDPAFWASEPLLIYRPNVEPESPEDSDAVDDIYRRGSVYRTTWSTSRGLAGIRRWIPRTKRVATPPELRPLITLAAEFWAAGLALGLVGSESVSIHFPNRLPHA